MLKIQYSVVFKKITYCIRLKKCYIDIVVLEMLFYESLEFQNASIFIQPNHNITLILRIDINWILFTTNLHIITRQSPQPD